MSVRLLQLWREAIPAVPLCARSPSAGGARRHVQAELGVRGDVERLAQGGAALAVRLAVFAAFEFPDPTDVDMVAGGSHCRVRLVG
ncbi:hypothetical protein GCM10010170_025950 [Dactylosporangium salmoneum]|uniref:Uncharacterized protein n=1 Tax=Dactylosporangium salmoneum TaxID=53361 RepID=A0ABP5SZT1_9ACTN